MLRARALCVGLLGKVANTGESWGNAMHMRRSLGGANRRGAVGALGMGWGLMEPRSHPPPAAPPLRQYEGRTSDSKTAHIS